MGIRWGLSYAAGLTLCFVLAFSAEGSAKPIPDDVLPCVAGPPTGNGHRCCVDHDCRATYDRNPPTPTVLTKRDRCDKYAAPDGSDSGDGFYQPFRTVQRLVDSLASGQGGCLRNGLYDTQNEIDLRTPNISIMSAPGHRASVRGRIVVFGSGDMVEDLDLDGSCAAGTCTLPSPTISAPNVVLRGNRITNRHTSICINTTTDGGKFPEPDHFVIVANKIHDCGVLPATNQDHGVYIGDGTGGVIAYNVIYRNADRGVQLYPEATSTAVLFNTIDSNGEGVNLGASAQRNDVEFNIVSNSNVRWNVEWPNLAGAGNVIGNNCVFASNANPYYNQSDRVAGVAVPVNAGVQDAERSKILLAPNPDGTPRFSNPSAGDYQQTTSSGCSGYGAPNQVAGP